METQIILEETNVEKIVHDVVISEERFEESATMMLTHEQVEIELTGLLYTFYKDAIGKKVKAYTDLLQETPMDVCSVANVTSFVPAIATQSIYYPNEKELDDIGDNDDIRSDVSFEDMSNFLGQVRRLQKAREEYHSAYNKIKSMYVPFKQRDSSEPVHTASDVINIYSTGTQVHSRILQGEKFEVVSYFNTAVPSSKEYHTFDLESYKQMLRQLQLGDKVLVCMNRFILTGTKMLYGELHGVISDITSDGLHIEIKSNDDSRIFVSFDGPSDAFVYQEHANVYRYCKSCLLQDNIKFINIDTLDFVLPVEFQELMYMLRDLMPLHLPNLHMMSSIAAIGKVNPRFIHKENEPIIRAYIDNAKLPTLVKTKDKKFDNPQRKLPGFLKNINVEGHTDAYYDTDVFRMKFMHSDFDFEMEVLTRMLSRYYNTIKKGQQFMGRVTSILKKMKEHLEDKLDNTAKPKEGTTKPEEKKTFAKIYRSVSDIEADNGKHVYFDSDLDPTEYGIKTSVLLDAHGNIDMEDHVRRKVISRHKKLTSEDIEFEVKSIIQGKRRVRLGDYCILDLPAAKFMYVRRKVANSKIWVKVSGLPATFCLDKFLSHQQLTSSDEAAIYDTHSKTCMSLESAIENAQIVKLKEKLSAVVDALNMLSNSQNIIEITRHFDEDANHFVALQEIIPEPNMASSVMKYLHRYQPNIKDIIDEGDYFEGEQPPTEEMTMTFEDQGNYATLNNQSDDFTRSLSSLKDLDMSVIEVTKVFSAFTGIKFSAEEVIGMTALVKPQLDALIKQDDIYASVEKHKRDLEATMNEQLAKKFPEYKRKFDDTVAAKVINFETKLLSEMYKDVILCMVAAFSIFIMIKYPYKVISSIYPACVRMFGYAGYPAKDDKNIARNLTKYLCCLMKNVCPSNDPRYSLISKLSADDMYTEVATRVDGILTSSPSVRTSIENTKEALNTPPKMLRDDKSDDKYTQTTFDGFKPIYMERLKTTNKAAQYIHAIHQAVKDTKTFKMSPLNMPLLLNTCCMEQLTPNMSYYSSIERDSNTFKSVVHHLKTHDTGSTKRTTKGIIRGKIIAPRREGTLTFDDTVEFNGRNRDLPLEESKRRGFDIPEFVAAHPTLFEDAFTTMKTEYENDDFWDNNVTPSIEQKVEFIVDVLSTYNEYAFNTFSASIETFKRYMIIMHALDDMGGTKYALVNYMKVDLPRFLSRLCNGKVDIEGMGNSVVLSNMNRVMEVMKDATRAIDKIFVQDDVKDMILMAYIVCTLFEKMIHGLFGDKVVPLRSVMTPNQAVMMSDVALIMTHVIHNMVTRIQLCANDVFYLRQRDEEFREKKKMEDIGLYKQDIEERKDQIAAKQLKIKLWHITGSEDIIDVDPEESPDQDQYVQHVNPNELPINETLNQQEEMENGSYAGYLGENYDGDEVDEDSPSHTMFVPERD